MFYFKTIFIIIILIFALFSCDIGARRFADSINLSAREFSVKPELLFAVAETESHFNATAKSKAGAIGLMQIMPKTGEWIADLLSIKNYSESDLYDPKINIRFASYYLAYLSSVFSEEWQVIAAYNAGEGAVKEWIEGKGVLSPEEIPYLETKEYVKRVKRAIRYYKDKKFVAFD